MPATDRNQGWARWGWLLTTIALGGAVIGSTWANYASARAATDDLIRAQARILHDVVLATNRPGGMGQRADLDSLVTAHADDGLRFVGWLRHDGEFAATGGTRSAAPVSLPDTTVALSLVRMDDRVRAFLPPPTRPNDRPPGQSPAGPAEGPPRGRPATMVLEFEPIHAAQLMARATRGLAIAVLVSLALVTAGIGFWRLSQRMESEARLAAEERRLGELGRMSAVLAHEIRNPLASLKGHAQLLLERLPDGDTSRRKAERVVDEAGRLESLTSDLLDFARSGPMDLRPVDPVALLRDAVATLPDGGIEIGADSAAPRWPLDARRFSHAVLGNILRNAAQSKPAPRPVQARVSVEESNLVFTIRDFGPGLPEGQEDRIFEPFFTTRTIGTGLGLAVARRIVEMHGGTLTASNATDAPGAEFRIELPRSEG